MAEHKPLVIEDPHLYLKYGAVERILAKMDQKNIPADLDREKLAAGLDKCGAIYQGAVDRKSDKPTQDRIRRLKRIIANAKKLQEQLHPDDLWAEDLADWENEYLVEMSGYLISRLESKIRDLEEILQWGPDPDGVLRSMGDGTYTPMVVWRSRTPFEWVAGCALPRLYSEHFGPPTFSRPDGKADSPYIRFAYFALIELGIRKTNGKAYSRETIARERPPTGKVGKS
jgi:hypothetical protein